MGITLLNVGFEEETNGGPRYQPSDEMVGEGGEANWTQSCSLKPCNSALLAVLGVPEADQWCAVLQVFYEGQYRGAYPAHCPKEAEG